MSIDIKRLTYMNRVLQLCKNIHFLPLLLRSVDEYNNKKKIAKNKTKVAT